MTTRRKTDRRHPRPIAHSLLIRYDYDAGRWIHSAGIVITPREATVLEALANGHGPANMAAGAGTSPGTFYAAQARLKQYLGIPVRSAQGHRQLLTIAMDLYGHAQHPRAYTPLAVSNPADSPSASLGACGEQSQERVSTPSNDRFAKQVSASSAHAGGALSVEHP